MSSKKTKLLESAQKNILKGQLDRAITEYRQIIELDSADLRHRQKIAELLTKAKRNEEAIKEYTYIAKHYIDTDHYLKAIAVYKQIQKLDPINPEITLTLATLNEKQGLIGNAVSEYSSVVQIYEKSGENLKALKALENIMALDADNSAVKLRIAEKYFTVGSEEKSYETFAALLQALKDRNDENGFNLILERAMNLFGVRIKETLGLIPADSVNHRLVHDAVTDSVETIVVPEDISAISPETGSAPPESTPAPTDILDVSPCEEIEYIEDIMLLDDDDVSTPADFSGAGDEWEEEISLPSLDTAPEHVVNQGVDQEILEEIEVVDELDDIELELEIANELSMEADTVADGAQSHSEEDFDLGKDLSLFADEIDFGLFSNQENSTAFDGSSAGFTRGELDNEDAESHYSLGLAYKEMGLWHEAIAEFVVAARSSERKIDALILEGVCHRELGNIDKSIEILADTLALETISEDERLGVQYELALCHEASGDFAEAGKILAEIVKIRPTFSDVATRLQALPH